MRAPAGYKFVVVDLSQIECRILNYLAGEQQVIAAFQEDRDIYSEGASRFYGREITRNDKLERHLGKTLELGCGFGMGPPKFRATCRAGALGGPSIILEEVEAVNAIASYRNSHPGVVAYWGEAGRMIARLAGGEPTQWGPMTVENHRIYLPNGAPLIYDTLDYDGDSRNWRLKTRSGWVKIYGGKLVENVVQALARVVLSQACLRIKNKLGLLPVLLAHDEGVWLVPDQEIELGAYNVMMQEMAREPTWLPGIPLACEGNVSEVYEK